jgi:hypothetical protein
MDQVREYYTFSSVPKAEPVIPLEELEKREASDRARYQRLLRRADTPRSVEPLDPRAPLIFQTAPQFVAFPEHSNLLVILE